MAEVFKINNIDLTQGEKKSFNPSEGPSFIPHSSSFKSKTRESESLVPLSQTDTVVGKVFEGTT